MTASLAQSIKARLLGRVHQHGEEFELILVRFVCERFLYRLGRSDWRDSCALKGAGLLQLWMGDPYRSTRDVDLLAQGDNSERAVKRMMMNICAISCTEDGLQFDLDSLTARPLRASQEYQGQRATMVVYLGTARIRLQVDFGFGDAVTPQPRQRMYPTLIEDLPAPQILVYPREAAIAEKFEAMVTLGTRNSRMKDFHDIWALSESFGFDGRELCAAVSACFERRRTPWTDELPAVLTSSFYADDDAIMRWDSYLRKGAFLEPPPDEFAVIGSSVRRFLGPVREGIVGKGGTELKWQPGGPWQ